MRALHPLVLGVYRLARWASGCFLFCTREAFQATGGFDEDVYAAEEVRMSRALARRGRFVILRESVTTSGRKLRTYSAWELARAVRLGASRRRSLDGGQEGLEAWYGERRPDPALAATVWN